MSYTDIPKPSLYQSPFIDSCTVVIDDITETIDGYTEYIWEDINKPT